MKHIAILGIDLQNDFTSPSGTLFVKGADRDVERIACFIDKNAAKIDYIALTLDSHQPIHIAHRIYWKDTDGNYPQEFSIIKADDVRKGHWIPQYNKNMALPYLEQLEEHGEVCVIWPQHCILGTNGWSLDKLLTDSLSKWAINCNKIYELFYKGYVQFTEHYSIFKAAVEYNDTPETQLNSKLLNILNTFDEIILIGEAADYCVANSLNDILDECNTLASKIVVLTDCMSWINPNNEKAKLIYDKAKHLGVRFRTSEDYSL